MSIPIFPIKFYQSEFGLPNFNLCIGIVQAVGFDSVYFY